jgi:hypothetical protein
MCSITVPTQDLRSEPEFLASSLRAGVVRYDVDFTAGFVVQALDHAAGELLFALK